MKLPWVSRAALDEAHETIALLRSQLEYAVQFHQRTIELYATQPVLPVKAAPVERAPTEPSPITKAIRDESAGDPRLAAFLRKRVRELKAEHPDWEDSQIADELSKWETTQTEATA